MLNMSRQALHHHVKTKAIACEEKNANGRLVPRIAAAEIERFREIPRKGGRKALEPKPTRPRGRPRTAEPKPARPRGRPYKKKWTYYTADEQEAHFFAVWHGKEWIRAEVFSGKTAITNNSPKGIYYTAIVSNAAAPRKHKEFATLNHAKEWCEEQMQKIMGGEDE